MQPYEKTKERKDWGELSLPPSPSEVASSPGQSRLFKDQKLIREKECRTGYDSRVCWVLEFPPYPFVCSLTTKTERRSSSVP